MARTRRPDNGQAGPYDMGAPSTAVRPTARAGLRCGSRIGRWAAGRARPGRRRRADPGGARPARAACGHGDRQRAACGADGRAERPDRGAMDRGRPARPGTAGGAGHQCRRPGRRRRHRRGRRRLRDRVGQGDRAAPAGADRRGPDDVRGLRGHQRLGPDRAGRQAHGKRRPGAAGVVVYDPDLVASMPPELAAASGLNAVAHCVDALWGPTADPIDAALAMEGLRALNDGLHSGNHARTQSGCYLAAVAFASAGSGLHHKICHVLGGRFDLPHAADARDRAAVRRRVQRAGRAGRHGQDRRRAGLHRRAGRPAGPPRASCAHRGHCASSACARRTCRRRSRPSCRRCPPSNPRPVDAAALSRLLRAAWAGDDPGGLA